MNTPKTQHPPSKSFFARHDLGVLAITLLLMGGCLLSLVGMGIQALRNFIMPRFGWIGLLLSANALIFIGPCLWNPTRAKLHLAASMTCLVGVINGAQLLHFGTVSSLENVFFDRLHSAWIWSVASFLGAGIYLAFAASRQRDNNHDTASKISTS